MSRIYEIRGPAAELVEIHVTLGGDVVVRVNGNPVVLVSKAKKISVDVPSQSIVITQKEKPRKMTQKEKDNEEWEMDQLEQRLIKVAHPKPEDLVRRQDLVQEHDEIMREVLGKEEGESLE